MVGIVENNSVFFTCVFSTFYRCNSLYQLSFVVNICITSFRVDDHESGTNLLPQQFVMESRVAWNRSWLSSRHTTPTPIN